MATDYVVIGAGSAGCAITYRLAEAGHTVTVIEHGGTDAGPLIQMPGALSFPMNMKRYDWGYKSEPEPHLGGRVLSSPSTSRYLTTSLVRDKQAVPNYKQACRQKGLF